MAIVYDGKGREQKRKAFAKYRREGRSIAESCRFAGMPTSTYYRWNKGDGWSTTGGWDKNDWP